MTKQFLSKRPGGSDGPEITADDLAQAERKAVSLGVTVVGEKGMAAAEYINSPALGRSKILTQDEVAALEMVVSNSPVAVFQCLNRALNSKGLCMSITDIPDGAKEAAEPTEDTEEAEADTDTAEAADEAEDETTTDEIDTDELD